LALRPAAVPAVRTRPAAARVAQLAAAFATRADGRGGDRAASRPARRTERERRRDAVSVDAAASLRSRAVSRAAACGDRARVRRVVAALLRAQRCAGTG